MTFMFWIVFFCSILMYFKFFKKKILVLLSLELGLVSIICLNLNFSFSSFSSSSFFCGMVFLTFMVVDSVFGLSLLIFSSRNSSVFSNFIFLF